MRNTRIGQQRSEPLPWRWETKCREANTLLVLPGATRIANRVWAEEVRELERFGFVETWDGDEALKARRYICELCGEELQLKMYDGGELGRHTYAVCTIRGCGWWLEF
ncbi:MAG: hypothetical protein LC808_21825 [Actinobacteria bacterium]|nr:hypothetical protein [Actinomycetota bacterium]